MCTSKMPLCLISLYQKRLAFPTSCSSTLPCVLRFWCLSFCVSRRPKASPWRRYQRNWPESEFIFHWRVQPSKPSAQVFFLSFFQKSPQCEAVQGEETSGGSDDVGRDNSERIQVRKRQNLNDAEGRPAPPGLTCGSLSGVRPRVHA